MKMYCSKNFKTKVFLTAFVGAMLLASCNVSDNPAKPVEPGKKYSTMLEALMDIINSETGALEEIN